MSMQVVDDPDSQLFVDDEVFRVDRKGRVQFGIITSTVEMSSSDEDDVDNKLNKGEVRAGFYSEGKEVRLARHTLGLVDRELLNGYFVRRIWPGRKKFGDQYGYVQSIRTRVDIRILGTKYVIRDVDSEALWPIAEWCPNVGICLDPWIGITTDVRELAVLRTEFGARIELPSKYFHRFEDSDTPRVRDVFDPQIFYPGNVVKGRLPSTSHIKNLTPELVLPSRLHSKTTQFTVETVLTSAVGVNWQQEAETMPEKPAKYIKDLKNLATKRINLVESKRITIHDRFYYIYTIFDKLVTLIDWKKEQFNIYVASVLSNKPIDNETQVTSELDASANEDGTGALTTAKDNAAAAAAAAHTPPTHTPSETKKKLRKKKLIEPTNGSQVVVETLTIHRSVTVVWQDGTVESDIPSTQLYPIHYVEDHEFFPGNFVSKSDSKPSKREYGVIQTVDHGDRIATVKWFRIYGSLHNAVPVCQKVEEMTVYDIRVHPFYKYAPGITICRKHPRNIGVIFDSFPDGRVGVFWPNGHVGVFWPYGYVTLSYPQELQSVTTEDQEVQDAFKPDGSENVEAVTQESDARHNPLAVHKSSFCLLDTNCIHEDHTQDELHCKNSNDEVERRTQLSYEQPKCLSDTSLPSCEATQSDDEATSKGREEWHDFLTDMVSKQQEAHSMTCSLRLSSPTSEHWFELLPGHHFTSKTLMPQQPMHYQRALRFSLPLRGLEDRKDLMSVMIVGAKRLSYQKALLLDIQRSLPYLKPSPTRHYISCRSVRNARYLYEEYAAQLGTWTGRGARMWLPAGSSIQGRYYIAGRERGTHEMAIINVARSMVKKLLNPPLVFRPHVLEHFRQHGNELDQLMQDWPYYSAKAWRLRSGRLKDNPAQCESHFDLACSRGICFVVRGMLDELHQQLKALSARAAITID